MGDGEAGLRPPHGPLHQGLPAEPRRGLRPGDVEGAQEGPGGAACLHLRQLQAELRLHPEEAGAYRGGEEGTRPRSAQLAREEILPHRSWEGGTDGRMDQPSESLEAEKVRVQQEQG